MQILSEYCLTVFGVLDRLEDVRMPELIHVFASKNVFRVVRIFRQHGEIGPVPRSMPSAYSRVQPSPARGSIALIFTESRSSAFMAAITCSTGRSSISFHCFLCLSYETRHRVVGKDPFRSVSATFFAFNTGLSLINLKRRMTSSHGDDSPKECLWKPRREAC